MSTKKTATMILLDVSAATRTTRVHRSDGDEGLFIDEAKWVATRILLRKIFADENDEVGVILMGSSVTDCGMAKRFDEGYENIQELCPMELASFKAVESILRLVPTDVEDVDWVAGLAAASDFMNKSCEGRRFRAKQIVILSPFASELEYTVQNVEDLIEGINSINLSISIIGTDPNDSAFDGEHMQLIRTACKLFRTTVHLSWDEAREAFKLYEKKTKLGRFTKMPLVIGDNLEIPMRHMKLNIDQTRVRWRLRRRNLLESNNEPTPNGATVETPLGAEPRAPENLPSSSGEEKKPILVQYKMDDCQVATYGQTAVVLTYADVAALKLCTGQRSLHYIASVRPSRITRAMLIGSDSYVFVAEPGERNGVLFSAFVDTLLKENRYALVRRVASTDGQISIGVLIPMDDELGKAMYFVQLPFSDYVQGVAQKLLPDEVDPKLSNIIDEIVDKMRLDDVEGRGVLVKDPSFQHRSNLIAQAALGPLVHSVTLSDDDIDRLYNPFKEMTQRAKPFIDELQRLYPIRVPVRKTRGKPVEVGKSSDLAAQLPSTSGNKNGELSTAVSSSNDDVQEVLKDMEAYRQKIGAFHHSEPNTEDILKDF